MFIPDASGDLTCIGTIKKEKHTRNFCNGRTVIKFYNLINKYRKPYKVKYFFCLSCIKSPLLLWKLVFCGKKIDPVFTHCKQDKTFSYERNYLSSTAYFT